MHKQDITDVSIVFTPALCDDTLIEGELTLIAAIIPDVLREILVQTALQKEQG